MKQVIELPAISSPTFGEKAQAIFRVIRKRLTREAVLNDLLTITITVVLTLLMAALILNYLSVDTLPGDFLYGAKRISENVQLSLAFDEERRTELENRFNQRRLKEIEHLLSKIGPR